MEYLIFKVLYVLSILLMLGGILLANKWKNDYWSVKGYETGWFYIYVFFILCIPIFNLIIGLCMLYSNIKHRYFNKFYTD